MTLEHITNIGQDDNEVPFVNLISKEVDPKNKTSKESVIGEGYESIIKRLGPDWVYKEVNPFDKKGNPKSSEQIEKARSRETAIEETQTDIRLEKIYGKDHFLRSYYVLGKNFQGEVENMKIQKLIHGKTLNQLFSGENPEFNSFEEMIHNYREQFKDLLWATKRAFIEYGIPLDYHAENFIRDDKTGKIMLFDSGCPSKDYREFMDTQYAINMPEERITGFFSRINRINQTEQILKLSEEEKVDLDNKYEITTEIMNDKIVAMHQQREKIESLRKEQRKREVEEFLDTVLGEREVVTGDDIANAALKTMEGLEIPEKTQIILDKLRKQGDFSSDKEYWMELIV